MNRFDGSEQIGRPKVDDLGLAGFGRPGAARCDHGGGSVMTLIT